MTKIELDNNRLLKYQKLKNNLEAVKEYFRHGDILIKEVNNTLEDTKYLIDRNLETSFTKEDFNDMLDLRDSVLYPIFKNASFAKEFSKYSDNISDNIPDTINTSVSTSVNYSTNNGVLTGATIISTVGDKVYETTYLTYSNGIIVEKKITKDNTTTTLKFLDNTIEENIVTISDNVLEITNNVYEDSDLKTTEYSKYINGIKE